ncbi:unnamed protein product [Acanthoscelides obtectus]|uniref:Uncharacterized protein n=1 Tax=Acanthoscelides obtectus TaxID=200917 RepID=A0A9P0MGK4_ACAOB|nr:unnamed protein product [Acanthoscelides obtectus]CAK1626693.1 hypothetical protein AOBTE_LOCUS4035 [Acanthoscelides obtectus]
MYTAATKGGERLLTKFEKQKLLKNANETWYDGPCRECKCSISDIVVQRNLPVGIVDQLEDYGGEERGIK